MGDRTGWNPVVGCAHVSAGCDNCYAAREASGRLSVHPLYAGLARDGKFTGEVRLAPARLLQPLKWRRPRRIFVNSMSDLFHAGVPDEFIAEVFAVMLLAPRHTFQVLTKRHGRMRSLLASEGFRLAVWAEACALTTLDNTPAEFTDAWPIPNVWLGVSVEDQQWADIRIPVLLGTPTAVRWVSAEPLLGPVVLSPDWLVPSATLCGGDRRTWTVQTSAAMAGLLRAVARANADPGSAGFVDWVVAGGESGPGARPMHPDWARSLRDQCQAFGVAYLFKQWSEWAVPEPGGAQIVARLGKKAAGRVLDGRTWDEYPDRELAR
jgi:protein gp37